jgi:hypothetical protein
VRSTVQCAALAQTYQACHCPDLTCQALGLVGGLAPEGVDLKGAAALLPGALTVAVLDPSSPAAKEVRLSFAQG